MKSDNNIDSSDSEPNRSGSNLLPRLRSNSAGSLPTVAAPKPCLVLREHLAQRNDDFTVVASTSIASTAVNNARNIVPNKSSLSTETATNLALEKVDLGARVLPEGVLMAAGVPVSELSSMNGNFDPTNRRRSSQVSLKRASHSRSPPPPNYFEEQEGQQKNQEGARTESTNDEGTREAASPTAAEQAPTQGEVDERIESVSPSAFTHFSAQQLIRRSTSAATSYLASDEDNSQDDDDVKQHHHHHHHHHQMQPVNVDLVQQVMKPRSKKHSSLRKRSSNATSSGSANNSSVITKNERDDQPDQESGYGASNFSMTSSGRSSAGCMTNSMRRYQPSNRTVRIVDSRDSDDDDTREMEQCSSTSRRGYTKSSPLVAGSSPGANQPAGTRIPNDEEEEEDQYSLDDLLNGSTGQASGQSGQQKHVTLDVRFAAATSLATISPPPSLYSRQSMSARNSTTGSDCCGFHSSHRPVRNFSIPGMVSDFKSVSAGHSVNMTPSRQSSFSANGLLETCYLCHQMTRDSVPGKASPSSDEVPASELKKAGRRYSGSQSASEPLYVVNLSSPPDNIRPSHQQQQRSPTQVDDLDVPSGDSFRGGNKWRRGQNISQHHHAKQSHHNHHHHLHHRCLPAQEKRKANFLVDGVRFQIDTRLLQAHPDTMLGRMFTSGFVESLNPGADIPMGMHSPDLSASVFRTVLDFYLCGKMTCPPDVEVHALREACDYFLIPFNYHTVRCNNIRAFLHELSDDGAYRAFEGFFDMHILPKLVECTRSGDRECHLVVLMDDEIIDWDETYPPTMPENELNSHLIFSTQMYRFLKYIENREVAKKFLVSKYLKKIRIGIEGYPTYKERVKYRAHNRPEVIYNYAQRPFIHMSWEHEENKSRHVDFQCVKSKSSSDLTSLEQVLGDQEQDAILDEAAPMHVQAVEDFSPEPASSTPIMQMMAEDESTQQPVAGEGQTQSVDGQNTIDQSQQQQNEQV